MQQKGTPELGQIKRALSAVTEYSGTLFDHAPIMIHSINQQGQLVKVNRRWLIALGYDEDEVIGQKSVDFLTDESRLVAIRDVLPLFWHAGSDRSIGFRFLRKNGRTLNVLMDSEVVPGTKGDLSGLATLRTPDSLDLWRQGSANLQRFKKLNGIQRQLENLLLPEGDEPAEVGRSKESRLSQLAPELTSAQELFGSLAEVAQDISSSLITLSRVHQEWRDHSLEQQDEVLLAMRSIDKTLGEMKDIAADLWSS